jgi:site-specific DNA-methyltransferase (adenine-specific)
MIDIGFAMRGEIIWNKASSASPSTAWGSWQSAANPILRDIHEYILIFSKGDYKRDKKGKEDTITRDQFMEWTKSIYFLILGQNKNQQIQIPNFLEVTLKKSL